VLLDEVTLEALGIQLDDKASTAVRADCVNVAGRIKDSGRRIIGLLPASAEIGVTTVGVQLGVSLVDVADTTVAYVDANIRWPAIARVAVGARPTDDESMFATRWLRGQLALLVPPRAGEAGAGLPQLARVIQHSMELFAHVIVDLTGFKKLGEHLAAVDMMDGVIVVARSGLTTEDELLRLNHEMPRRLNLGVLLVHV
jgi:hypothetical protein